MKLIVSHLEALRTYVTRELYFIQHDLITNHGWQHIEADYLYRHGGSLEYKLRSALGELPEIIIFWEPYELVYRHCREMQGLKCRKYFFADDLHWFNRRMREIKVIVYGVSDVIVSPVIYRFSTLFPELSLKRTVWVPHSASTDFMLPFNSDAENSIFLSGAMNEAYPLRQQMLQLHREGSYAIRYHRHPGYYCGYDYERDGRIGRGYAEKIRECRIGFADSVFPFRYIVAKFFEIPATGALLLADDAVSEYLNRLGFVAGRHYVPVSQSNLAKQIEYVLSDSSRDELDQVRRNGQALVHEQHKTSDRARFINAVCAA